MKEASNDKKLARNAYGQVFLFEMFTRPFDLQYVRSVPFKKQASSEFIFQAFLLFFIPSYLRGKTVHPACYAPSWWACSSNLFIQALFRRLITEHLRIRRASWPGISGGYWFSLYNFSRLGPPLMFFNIFTVSNVPSHATRGSSHLRSSRVFPFAGWRIIQA